MFVSKRHEEAHILATQLGWFVFPIYEMGPDGICTCGHQDCQKPCCAEKPRCSPGKHPRTFTGLKEASNNPEMVYAWWLKWPDANIGVATGPSNLYIVDVDPKNGGSISLEKLIAQHGEGFMKTLRSITGSKGLHLFFQQEKEDRLRNTAGALGDGIDTRGDGGYIVAPSSNHVTGNIYEWAKEFSAPSNEHVLQLPDWMAKKIREEKPNNGPAPPVPQVIPKGARNDVMTSLAGTMHRRGFTINAIRSALQVQNKETCVPPMGDRELERIIHNVSRYNRGPPPAQRKTSKDDWWSQRWP